MVDARAVQRPHGLRGVALILLLVFALVPLAAGCRASSPSPSPSPSTPGATPRPFTVLSTDAIRVTDPAAITDTSSAILATNVFQRLMTADPGESVLKPDAARECLFTAVTTYTCTLSKDLAFSNGHPITAADVKFSIERATRLNVAGSSASALSSLRKIETPDPMTVRFLLSRPDTQFGWALAAPAASLVDPSVYDADTVQDPKDPIVGSGPYTVVDHEATGWQLARYPKYIGRTPAGLDALVYKTVADSASIEDAMDKGTVEVVWRGLNAAAVTRLSAQVRQNPDGLSVNGYRQDVEAGVRVLQLAWSPGSAMRRNKPLRAAIAAALQGDRTLDSVVPGGVPGHTGAFPLGGKTTPKVTWKNRINLTLGYDPTAPNALDTATQIRTRLEDTGGLGVRIRPDDPGADLQLLDRKAWTPTVLAWLQPYLDAPLAGSATTAEAITSQYRAYCAKPVGGCTTDDATANALLASLQRQAATDLLVLPISQTDEYVYLRDGVGMTSTSFGPGWQLGLFGLRRG